ncbi:hypothetical protein NQ318_011678 [Aromia moschata]|uniref:Retrotransposon gag domain-containing protein n=1 Tax=Aromia moschata TaxID=1265417 RepID=A0AAV8X3J5_9CUCU|nr:hypothetical protein NQ318_011678 [Aromia moschata]
MRSTRLHGAVDPFTPPLRQVAIGIARCLTEKLNYKVPGSLEAFVRDNILRTDSDLPKANGWSLADILQTLSLEEQEDYHQLVRHLEMRYGQSHLEHVYHSQLENRCQKNNESLQEFEAGIERLVRLAYLSIPENAMERLAVQAFLDGLRDTQTRQALILARPSKLVDALARALEFEPTKQSSRSQAKVRKM